MKKHSLPRRDAGRPRGAAIEQLLLRHALLELAEFGVHGLSIERIAARAELNKTSIYRRFPSKEALIAASLEAVFMELSAAATDTGSLRGDLLALLSTIAAFLSEPSGAALFRAAIDHQMAPTISELASRLLAEGGAAPVLAMLTRANDRNEWRIDASPETVMTMLVGALLHRLYLERRNADGPWLNDVVDIVLRGCASERLR